MSENIQINRILEKSLPEKDNKRLLLLTGARQTGKTTLLRKKYHELSYYNLDAIEFREQLAMISSFAWSKEVGSAILDEIQKAPDLIDKVKFAFDEGGVVFSAISGSAQILLLKKVKESLAGRITITELFPFVFAELQDIIADPQRILLNILLKVDDISLVLRHARQVLLGESWEERIHIENELLKWGGMPPLMHIDLEEDKLIWLRDYISTYLERDMRDLSRLDDLNPFSRFQRLAALRSSSLLSYSELARDAGISVETARRYFEYLQISYQAFLLYPYHSNLTSSLVKTPKLYWYDNGIMKLLSGMKHSVIKGEDYENYVASEIMKLLKTEKSETSMSFYRTRSGMEVDFILENANGIYALEVKNRTQLTSSDLSGLKRLAETDKVDFCGGMLVYRGNQLYCHDKGLNIWAVPSCRLFGSEEGI